MSDIPMRNDDPPPIADDDNVHGETEDYDGSPGAPTPEETDAPKEEGE